MLSRADLDVIHKFCGHHRDLPARSDRGGCFYCGAMFDPREVTDWIDEPQVDTGSTDDGVTALRPRCGIDAIPPSAAPIPLDEGVLTEMHRHWFER